MLPPNLNFRLLFPLKIWIGQHLIDWWTLDQLYAKAKYIEVQFFTTLQNIIQNKSHWQLKYIAKHLLWKMLKLTIISLFREFRNGWLLCRPNNILRKQHWEIFYAVQWDCTVSWPKSICSNRVEQNSQCQETIYCFFFRFKNFFILKKLIIVVNCIELIHSMSCMHTFLSDSGLPRKMIKWSQLSLS